MRNVISASSATSNSTSRTTRLKALFGTGTSAKSKEKASDRSAPRRTARVAGWSPSSVRNVWCMEIDSTASLAGARGSCLHAAARAGRGDSRRAERRRQERHQVAHVDSTSPGRSVPWRTP